jgi:hypothetical protein
MKAATIQNDLKIYPSGWKSSAINLQKNEEETEEKLLVYHRRQDQQEQRQVI